MPRWTCDRGMIGSPAWAGAANASAPRKPASKAGARIMARSRIAGRSLSGRSADGCAMVCRSGSVGRFPQETDCPMRPSALLVALIAAMALLASPAQAATSRTIGGTRVLATVPYPGHPGGIAIDGRTVYVDTFNPVDRATDDYDAIFTYDRITGKLRTDRPNPIKVPRMMSPTPMGLAAIALDK